MKRTAMIVGVLALAMSTTCIEFQTVLSGVIADRNGGSPPSGTGTDPTGNGDTAQPPEVTMTVSNPNPSVNEEVLLTCRSASAIQPATSFAFQPAGLLFGVNSITGTAVFLPSEADIGTAFEFTCTGTNENGTGSSSTAIAVIPVGSGAG